MTSFSSLPWATKLQFFIPTSEHFSSFAMSGLLRRDVLRLRESSRVGSTESKFREHEPRRFVPGRPCVSVPINFVSLWREDGLPGRRAATRKAGGHDDRDALPVSLDGGVCRAIAIMTPIRI